MKKCIELNLIFLLSIFLNSQLIISQETTNKISFVKIDENKGYLIDSLENLNCKCLPVTGKSFLYAALLQLPNSSFVLRIKNENIIGFTDIKLHENDIKKLYNKKLYAYAKKLIKSLSEEEDILKSMVSDSAEYQLIDYEELKIPYNVRKQSLCYLKLGVGLPLANGASGELGVIDKKNIFSFLANIKYDYDKNNSIYTYNDCAVLYSRYINSDFATITFSSGISSCNIRVNYYSYFHHKWMPYVKTFNTIGLPLKIGVSFFPQYGLGVGFDVFADINKQASFAGFVFCLRFGRLKSKFY